MEVKDLSPTDSVRELVAQLKLAGFQGTSLGRAHELIQEMLSGEYEVLLSFPANLVASGLRGILREMVKRKLVSVVFTTAGAVEHDFARTRLAYSLGEFRTDDWALREKGLRRVGNIVLPWKAYEEMEREFLKMAEGREQLGSQELAYAFGRLAGPGSIFYWCWKNEIPVAIPGIVDGAFGLFTGYVKQKKEFLLDPTDYFPEVMRRVLTADRVGGIVLGGGISKHHLIGSAILREGLDLAVYFTSAQEWDGSLSGARPSEAVSWQKIKGRAVVVYGDAVINFSLAMMPFLAGN